MTVSSALRFWLTALAAALAVGAAHAQTTPPADSDPVTTFKKDLDALCSTPHRLAGTTEAANAANHVVKRLGEIGIKDIRELEMPVVHVEVKKCQLTVGDKRVSLLPVRSNFTVPPATGPDGLTGPLLYAGRGTLVEYGVRNPDGAIVVLEYDCADNWQRAFSMGAKAVVFLGDKDVTDSHPKHLPLPMNAVRLYAPPAALEQLDLRKDADAATVISHLAVKQSAGRNIVALIKATDPLIDPDRNKPEVLVLSATLDTFGQVPRGGISARKAANVAALLAAAKHFQDNRPRRHILLAFLDNHWQQRHGARALYPALMLESDLPASLAAEHKAEAKYIDTAERVLTDSDTRDWARELVTEQPSLRTALREQADFRRADAAQEVSALRLHAPDSERVAELDAIISGLDSIRRVLTRTDLTDLPDALRDLPKNPDLTPAAAGRVAKLRDELPVKLLKVYQARRRELASHEQLDSSIAALRDQLDGAWIALHVTFNLSGDGPRWGVVAGDSTAQWLSGYIKSGDSPGLYGAVLRAFRRAVEADTSGVTPLAHLDTDTLEDPAYGVRFPTGLYANDGLIAGTYGVYNVAIMTGADARPRDGHPADTVRALNWKQIQTFGAEATRLIGLTADTADLSIPRKARPAILNDSTRWDAAKHRAQGNFVGLQVTGGLKEDRPAAGAVTAMWPWVGGPWTMHGKPTPLDFCHAVIQPASAHGYLDFISVPKAKLFGQLSYLVFATTYDEYGRVKEVVSQKAFIQQNPGRYRVEMIAGRPFGLFYPMLCTSDSNKHKMQVLGAVTNAAFPDTRYQAGELLNMGYFFLSERDIRDGGPGVKIFSTHGPAMLGIKEIESHGDGVPLDAIETPPAIDEATADSLWKRNERWLRIMRRRGIANAPMERIHYQAADDMRQAADAPVAERQAALAASAARSRRIYGPIRESLDDLVTAAVILLLLAMGFAFAMERLLICASTVYGRLAGFAIIFILTFIALYLLHPGFAVATTPIIIFLAFVIILLASMVIFILLRKFNVELQQMQGQSAQAHAVVMSRMGTLIAAASLGMSTMRRRPLRTALTALTVLLLSFTILCFASVGMHPGVRSMYLGATGSAKDADVLIRRLDYSALPTDVPEVIAGRLNGRGKIATQWWVSLDLNAPPISIARADDGRSAFLQSVMGLQQDELADWPDLAASLRDDRPAEQNAKTLDARSVYLPPVISEQLELQPGDAIRLNGYPAIYAGVISTNAMQRLRHIDNERALPVDFQDAEVREIMEEQSRMGEQETADMQRSFARLSPNQVAVTTNDLVREMGGTLHVVRLYLDKDLPANKMGDELAQVMPTPIWIRGPKGAERLVFTTLLEVQAGEALFVPLVLGGLIVFGTMLGSITDRQKEIYTFSALGLSPGHVGLLFFAEAAVYAVVGGMGGQLLAQVVAVAARSMARAGMIAPPSLNFSSTNSLLAIFVVMLTVLLSALYPALRASRSANPGLARSWKMPKADGDDWSMVFPFTVSAYDITGVVSYLAEHFRGHDDAGLGKFIALKTGIRRAESTGNLTLWSEMALAPFDLGVTQHFELTATPSEIEGVDEVAIAVRRLSGSRSDWARQNRVFIRGLRNQFLLWRTLAGEAIEGYRLRTLQEIGETDESNDNDDAADRQEGDA